MTVLSTISTAIQGFFYLKIGEEVEILTDEKISTSFLIRFLLSQWLFKCLQRRVIHWSERVLMILPD